MTEHHWKRPLHHHYKDKLLGPQGLEELAADFPDRREFATDADRQRAIAAHRRRVQREIRKRRR